MFPRFRLRRGHSDVPLVPVLRAVQGVRGLPEAEDVTSKRKRRCYYCDRLRACRSVERLPAEGARERWACRDESACAIAVERAAREAGEKEPTP